MRKKFRPQSHPVIDMEVERYLKAKRKKNMKKQFPFFIHTPSRRTS